MVGDQGGDVFFLARASRSTEMRPNDDRLRPNQSTARAGGVVSHIQTFHRPHALLRNQLSIGDAITSPKIQEPLE